MNVPKYASNAGRAVVYVAKSQMKEPSQQGPFYEESLCQQTYIYKRDQLVK